MSTSWLWRAIDARVQMQKMRETSMGFIDGETRGKRWFLDAWAGFQAYGAVPLRHALVVALGLSSLGVLLVAIRLIPLMIHPDVPLSVLWLFVRDAMLSAAEMALLATPAIGWAVAASSLAERGEARALSAMGVRPGALLIASWPGLVLVSLGLLICAALWGGTAEAPGRLGREVLMQARRECVDAASHGSPAASAVPLLGLSWVCMPGGAVRLVGPLPTTTGQATLSAAALRPSDDLRTIDLDDAVILADSGDRHRVALRLARARLTGLNPPMRSSPRSRWERAIILACSSAWLGLCAGGLVLRRALRAPSAAPSRTMAAVAGTLAAGLSIACWSGLERAGAPLVAYASVPTVGGLVLAVLLGRLPGAARGGTPTSVHKPRMPRAREEIDECDSVPPRFS